MKSSGRFAKAFKRVIIQQTKKLPRHGEGSAVLMKSGAVYLVHSRFTGGGADHDTAELSGGILKLKTGRLTGQKVLFPSKNALNQMSASIERLSNGDWGIVWIRKTSKTTDDIYFSRSADEGKHWSKPVKINRNEKYPYYVINNDRLRQFSSGRLAAPVCIYPGKWHNTPAELAMFYSDDGGKNWKLSGCVRLLKENMVRPQKMNASSKKVWAEVCKLWGYQEPGVEELADGRILMYCRTTNGYMYQSYSNDGGLSWGPLKAAKDIVSCCGPQSIRRLPGSKRLMCVFNDHRDWPFGAEKPGTDLHWNWRTPLSIAVSDDNARSWRVLGNVEDSSRNYCYTSILFVGNKVLLTDYESENKIIKGKTERRNLASLKMQLINRRDLE
jgi:hypothetical protein